MFKGIVEFKHFVLRLWEASKQIIVKKYMIRAPQQLNHFFVPPSSQKWPELGD